MQSQKPSKNQSERLQRLKMELALEKKKKELEYQLPHLYAMKMYPWQRTFHDSKNRFNLICSANQIGKSSIAIRRVISNATDTERWKWLYKRKPTMFWYFYPDSATLDREFTTKWEAEWLPRGAMKDDPRYGWTVKRDKGIPTQVQFNSGVTLYFLFYTKKAANMQAGSVDDLTVDEELPMELYSELTFRLAATEGIFNMVCTPTLNQPFWKSAIESQDILPHALKLNVSMFDCLKYEDGTPSTAFTVDKINNIIATCKSSTEVQRRVFGKFVTEEGRMFFAYSPERNMIERHDIANWLVYAGIDYGSGGTGGHPAAIVFCAVRPDYQRGVIFKAWRGDGVTTTAGDVLEKYIEMARGLRVVQAWYDYGSKDLGILAERAGVNVTKAEKARDFGASTVNTLFRHQMLSVFHGDEELDKLSGELLTVMKDQGNSKTGDDLVDAARYCVIGIPWDLSQVEAMQDEPQEKPKVARMLTEEELLAQQIEDRRGQFKRSKGEDEPQAWRELEQEFEDWNEMYGN